MKKFEIASGHELRGFVVRLYPDKETEKKLRELEDAARPVWNWLVGQTEEVIAAREAYAIRNGLVSGRPQKPVILDGLEPEETSLVWADYRDRMAEWRKSVHEACKDRPECAYRKFSELVAHFGHKHDYQLLASIWRWKIGEGTAPGAHFWQAITKNFFTKSDRRKKRRKLQEPMPLQVRSGRCFELGNFGARGLSHRRETEGPPEPFYNCRVKFNGVKILGRLPGKIPGGRWLEGISIKRAADGWYGSIKVEVPIRQLPKPIPGTVVGIDFGLDIVAAFAAPKGQLLPEGIKDRVLNRRGKEFSDLMAAKQQLGKSTAVARLQQKAARHARHVIYNDIVKVVSPVETIKVEKLPKQIGQMGGSTKKSTMRTAFRLLKERYGDRVREVAPHYTSQDCSQCGVRSKESWSYEHGRYGKCPSCGHTEDRDVNAARNIAGKEPLPLGS